MKRRLPITLFISVLLHLGLWIGLISLAHWRGTQDQDFPSGGVIWLNLNPGGEGTGGLGGMGVAQKESTRKNSVAPTIKKKTYQLPLAPSPLSSKEEWNSHRKEITEGDGSGEKTGNGNGTGKGSGQGKGAGIGSGEGPGGLGPLGTGGLGGNGSSTLAEIRRQIAQAKRYPQEARRERIEGICGLSFAINADGSLREIRLTSSSGYQLLDTEAVATVARAAPFPFYEKPIRLSLKFSLND